MSWSNSWKIKRVPALMQLAEEKKQNDYYPKVGSIGPYHYGESELALVEAFKPMAVELFVRGPQEVYFFYNEVLNMIGEVRNCSEEEFVAEYSNEALAQMMLRDASLIIILLETRVYLQWGVDEPVSAELLRKSEAVMEHLGTFRVRLLLLDFILVENQIPLSVVELLIKLRYGEGQYGELIYRYVNLSSFGEDRQRVPLPQPPLHLLEFTHMLLAWEASDVIHRPLRSLNHGPVNLAKILSHSCCCTVMDLLAWEASGVLHWPLRSLNHNPVNLAKRLSHSFRTVMDLKAKGIHFRPSATQSLTDVKFEPGFFHATLQLPTKIINDNTKAFFKNLIAFELLSGGHTKPVVGSYIDLMKSLIVRVEDVKELRERKILYTLGSSDEDVLTVYKNIKLYGSSDITLFLKVRDDIQAHYNNSLKTWMAELIHTHFRSPWTLIAFLAAATIIALTAAQLHYAVHPSQNS